jgi:threonyl-tRNA synthetase
MNPRVATKKLDLTSLYLTMAVITFFGLIVLYMYFLTMSVVHVVLRKEVVTDIREVESQIASLESSYINAQHAVSDKMATLESFTQNDNKIFVERDARPTFVLSDAAR